ncbi:MAG: UGSC family (seleno)protein [Nocardioidaceae bacterium]
MADLQGAPGYRYATTAHPVASLDPAGVRARAATLVPRVVALLTDPVLAGRS